MSTGPAVLTEGAQQISPLGILEDTGTKQSLPAEKNIPKDDCIHQASTDPTLFTVGFPESRMDALPRRKSFRDGLRSLSCQSTISNLNLCINCREAGHILKECPYLAYRQALDWTMATPIHTEVTTYDRDQKTETLCSRCEGLTIYLDKAGNPIDQTWPGDYSHKNFEQSADWITLGPVASLIFKADCSFCRLLFSITQSPNNRSGELILTKTNSNQRLSASRYFSNDKFSTCAYTATKPTEVAWNNGEITSKTDLLSENAMAAICYLSKDCLSYFNGPPPLGGRRVNQFSINESILCMWLQRCEKLHGNICSPEYYDELRGIRLVDVTSRQVVSYPTDQRCDYIALSYVWGKCQQRSYRIGSCVGRVPQTIEDAMTVTKVLGKKYLWVDSLTIDQRNSSHKAAQIKLMSFIYRGAWATIVALSGRSAAAGLPRVNTGKKLYPDIIFPQASANLNGKQIVSTMPTLAQQTKLSQWTTRAWTLQEGLLSPRCLYFTQHQVYFQCNTFQCCESIDDTTSPQHNEETPVLLGFGNGVLQSHFLLPSNDRIKALTGRYDKSLLGSDMYYKLLAYYSPRKMSSRSDKINAFSGVLQALESIYFKEHGFHYGIPVAELPWSLLWEGDCVKSIINFPSWSWAGWETTWTYDAPPLMWCDDEVKTCLRILKPENGLLVQIYQSTSADYIENEERLDLVHTDPLWPLSRQDPEGPLFPSNFSTDESISYLLFIEGIVLSFLCPVPAKRIKDRTDWTHTRKYDRRDLELGGVKCSLRYVLTLGNTLLTRFGQPQEFLVIARDFYDGNITYRLLLLDGIDGIMYRQGVVDLVVSYNENYCIKHANPRRIRLVLG